MSLLPQVVPSTLIPLQAQLYCRHGASAVTNTSPGMNVSVGTDASTETNASSETNTSSRTNASSRTDTDAAPDTDQLSRVDPQPNVDMIRSSDEGMMLLIYYRNQYTETYKIDERVMKNKVQNNVRCNKKKDKLKFIIYYRNSTITSLITKKLTVSSVR